MTFLFQYDQKEKKYNNKSCSHFFLPSIETFPPTLGPQFPKDPFSTSYDDALHMESYLAI